MSLYGTLGQDTLTDSDLYLIDTSDGSSSSLGALGDAISGLAFDFTTVPPTLYGVTIPTSSTNPSSLVTIDPLAATVTLVAALSGLEDTFADISFDSQGHLYGWGATTLQLFQIDKVTAVETPHPTPPDVTDVPLGSGYGLAFDGLDRLWVAPTGDAKHTPATPPARALYQVDAGTGLALPNGGIYLVLDGYGTAGGFGTIDAACFSGAGVLYCADDSETAGPPFPVDLVKTNTTSGLVTKVGALPNGLAGLAFDVPPGQPPSYQRIYGVTLVITDEGLEQPALLVSPQ